MIKQIYLFIVILMGVWLTGCQDFDDFANEQLNTDGNMVEVTIATKVPGITVQSRTDGTNSTEKERELKQIDILVFKVEEEGTEIIEKFAYRVKTATIVSGENSGSDIYIKAKLKVSDENEKYRLVFIGNLEDNELDFIEDENIGDSKDELLKEIIFKHEEKWPTEEGSFRPIPMWAESKATAITTNANNNDFGDINFIRSVARIELSVNTDGNQTNGSDFFEIKSVKVYNAREKGRAIPDSGSFVEGEATSPSLVVGQPAFIEEANMLYAPETNKNAVTGIYVNESPKEELFLIIGADYKGEGSTNKTTYYKIGFYNKDDSPVAILRNFTYNMVITSVTGPGENTEEDAKDSDSSNLTVAMTEWSNGDMKHVVFNGKNFLAVSESALEISRSEETHSIVVQTNYSTGWTAKVLKGSEWITELTSYPPTAALEEKIPLSFKVSENTEENGDREGIIRLSCGEDHLSLDVYIVQTTKIVYTLKIMINNPDNPNDFIEFDRVITFPSGYHYGNDEDITPRTLKIEWTPKEMPLLLEFNPYFAWGEGTDTTSVHNTNGETTFTVVPKKLSERSQEEWYPEAVGDIQIQIGNDSTNQQNILIRRRHHEVYIEKADRYVIADADDTHSFMLYSNTKWKALIPTTLSDSEETILLLEKKEGDSNVIGADPGEEISFKLSSSALTTSFASTIPITIQFEDVDGRPFTKEYDFDVYYSNEDPDSGTKFGGKANCYVIHTNGNSASKPHKVSIPVVGLADDSDWNKNHKITSDLSLSPKLIWIDNDKKIGMDNSTIRSIEIEQEGTNARDARLIVTAGSSPGNAVVAVVSNENGTEKIHWSWHIWVVDDVNFDPDDDSYDWPGYRYYRFLDRNLGALSADPADVESGGLYYQWGRKDPFAVSGTDSQTASEMYNENGGKITLGINRERDNRTNSQEAMDYSIEHPEHFMSPTASTNWLSTSWTAGLGDNLWNEMEGGSLSTSKKGVFDPCPDGWKTIPGGRNIANEWTLLFGQLTYVQKGNNAYSYSWVTNVDAGKWPHTGYINQSGQRTATGDGRYWTGTNNEFSVAYHFRFQQSSNHPSESFNKTSGLPVRCMRRSETLKVQ